MKCPFCGHDDTQVKDSRPSDDGGTIRRRRFCPACDSRFTTLERVQLRELTVMKRSGERRPFDRDKIARSMAIALRKRPVDSDTVERTVNRIVQTLENSSEGEVACETIGQLVMEALQSLDQVAYIRYASVYRDFREAGDFEKFMEGMASRSNA
jgi:transcriptional repressor NrdR